MTRKMLPEERELRKQEDEDAQGREGTEKMGMMGNN